MIHFSLQDPLAPPHLTNFFSPTSVDPLLSILEADDLSFTAEFLSVAITSPRTIAPFPEVLTH